MFHARDGAIFSKNSTFVFFDGASPITENGIQLRSPSPIIIDMKMLVFVPAKCVRTAVKTMVVDRKNQKTLALLYLASKPLQKAANSSGVPIEFATEPTRQI